LKEYELETGGNPTCAAWMETDNSLFAAGYDNSSLAFFNHNTGKLEFQDKLSSDSAITCLVTHAYQPLVICGHADGSITVYDSKDKKVLHHLTHTSEGAVQSICFLNNCLHLVVGHSSGSIHLHETKGNFQLLTIVENAHHTKFDEGVHALLELEASSDSRDST